MTATAATARPTLGHTLLRGLPGRTPLRLSCRMAVWVGATAIAASALIHLHLWFGGYRHIHLIGPAFLLQVLVGTVTALALVAFTRVVTVLAGAAYCLGSAVALILSATVGFLGLHDGLSVPWATASLTIELAGGAVLLGCLPLMLRAR